jgi:hypothetical protein
MDLLKDYDRDETYLGFDGIQSLDDPYESKDQFWEMEQNYKEEENGRADPVDE